MQEIQNKLIKDYGINIVKSCECLSRGHAHVDGTRRICNWKQEENIGSTFTLLHEIGHIETFKSSMRRAESEYHATQWALDTAAELGLDIPDNLIEGYQRYIDWTKERGIRRGGSNYSEMKLYKYLKAVNP